MPNTTIPDTHLPILETAIQGMLSTIRYQDGLISTNPVGFDWDGEFVRISTLKARVKYRNLLANPLVAFCVLDPLSPARYVEIRGTAEITEDPHGELNRKMYKRHTGKDFDLDEPGAERVIIKIIPLQVSTPKLYGGRLDRVSAQVQGVPGAPSGS